MARLDAVMAEQLGPPDTFAKKMRRAYLMFFAPSVICAAAAFYFSFIHIWAFVGCFVASTLIHFPVALRQHRSSKENIEKAITEYEVSYQEYNK